MKIWTKTASMMFLSAALLAACGDDDADEEANGEGAPDNDRDITEAEEDDADEGVDVDATEEDDSDDENGSSDDFAEDQQLSLGETGTYDANFGTFEITLDDVWTDDEVEGEPPVDDLYVITEVTVENNSDDTIDAQDLAHADLLNEDESNIGVYWFYGFDGDLEPGESLTGELVFDHTDSSYYELTYGWGPDSLSNEVRWEFDESELEE
ncbi:DUF4352 domain-containing protein [Salicibibacter cibarius]|uniref:DUF4352 domain-containing protein n=1 Tax=Salicibibacter cibarius TaxID=2743000 RepID=A0A7T6Z683_9BACI|nr:DUF4352 domain-containing protein [Salicibibacter cibarius]QQK77620.1 DUF4352 domain-containing protein [Salicibibacter cibarius]